MKKIGSFILETEKAVITDPGHDVPHPRMRSLGIVCEPCAKGQWHVFYSEVPDPINPPLVLGTLIATQLAAPNPRALARLDWNVIQPDLGGDFGMVGVFDKAHFHDPSVVPSDQKWTYEGGPGDPKDLWYSLVLEGMCEPRPAFIIPFGCVLHLDRDVQVSVVHSPSGVIQAFRLVSL